MKKQKGSPAPPQHRARINEFNNDFNHKPPFSQPLQGRFLPQDIKAEQCVLGAILTDGGVINQVLEILTPDDFYLEEHKAIFRSMMELHNLGIAVDPSTLSEYMKLEGGASL